MPQLTLKLSRNIDASLIDFDDFFYKVHEALCVVPSLDVSTAHSGVIQEEYSYIGLGHPTATKVYLELCWIESQERVAIRSALGKVLLNIIEETIVPIVEAQGLLCIPRVRIANLGLLNDGYFIASK